MEIRIKNMGEGKRPGIGPDLIVSLFMIEFAQVVETAGNRALMRMRVLQVFIRDLRTLEECASGFFCLSLVHENNASI